MHNAFNGGKSSKHLLFPLNLDINYIMKKDPGSIGFA